MPRAPSTTRRGASATLVVLLSGALVLAGVLLWFLARPVRTSPLRGEAPAAGSVTPPRSADDRTAEAPAALAAEREPVDDPTPTVVAPPPLPGGLRGLLVIDDGVPQGGELVLRAEGREWEVRCPLDRFGRFAFADLPLEPLQLAFEPTPLPVDQPGEPRRLLSPSIRVVPEPGHEGRLELDWSTTHVNVRVVGDGSEDDRSVVEVEGPALRASFDTDEHGKARLAVVGDGLFVFRAVQPSGKRGEAELVLDEDVDLETVVISASAPESEN